MLKSEAFSQKNNEGGSQTTADIADMEAWRRRLFSVRRTCNSEDAPEAAEQGICSKNANEYAEVRLASQN